MRFDELDVQFFLEIYSDMRNTNANSISMRY